MAAAPDNHFTLTLITNDPAWIEAGEAAGVDRIGVDVERLGKSDRQRAVADARISAHEIDDLRLVSANTSRAQVFARLNSLHPGSRDEVEKAIGLGAQVLMLPAFRSVSELQAFGDLVDGRADVTPLVETAAALARLEEVAGLTWIKEVMLGLNDLHLEMKLSQPLEVAASGLLDWAAASVRGRGKRFGFGGVAHHGVRGLPVDPDLVLARYAEVGARSAWIARSFFADGLTPDGFADALALLRGRLDHWFAAPADKLATAREALRRAVAPPPTPPEPTRA